MSLNLIQALGDLFWPSPRGVITIVGGSTLRVPRGTCFIPPVPGRLRPVVALRQQADGSIIFRDWRWYDDSSVTRMHNWLFCILLGRLLALLLIRVLR